MRDFLNEYIVTLSGKRRTHINDLLSSARISKNDLDALADKLRDARKDSPIVIKREVMGSLIDNSNFYSVNQDVYRRMKELFDVSNEISLLLDSHTNILSSEIKALEDEINAMEKAISNYAFTLADNGFYDYAFTETFNDETMREVDINVGTTDRSNVNFSSDEKAVVNSAAGILSLSPSLINSYPITGHIKKSNCLYLATSNTGVKNAFNSLVSNGWRIAVSSPKPFTSVLDAGITKQGAQVELEIFLDAPSPCDSLVLTPFSYIPLDVLRISIYDTNTDDAKVNIILDSPQLLDRPTVFNFPLQSVSKFKIILNQSVYSRGELSSIKSETTYREFYNDIKDTRQRISAYSGKTYNKNRKALKRIFLKSLNKRNNIVVFKSETPELDFDPTYGPLTLDKIVKGFKPDSPSQDIWSFKSKIGTYMRRMIDESIFPSNPDMIHNRFIYNVNQTFPGNPLQITMASGKLVPDSFNSPQQAVNADFLAYPIILENQYLTYNYDIGLRNIEIGTGERIYRGVFITKQIPAPSDSGEVKIKVDDTNYEILETSRDSRLITSIEYSISNKSTPVVEEDWIPILPIDSLFVAGERLFLTEFGLAKLRFPASTNGNFEVFKNGYKVDLDSIVKNKAPDGSITSIQFPVHTFISTDIFTINYQPNGNQNIINFENRGLGQSLLASAYDSSGAGETFTSTYNNQIITLSNEPYINYDQVNKLGSYSSTLGFTGTYQPITIVMSDGTLALNQTNYKGISQNNLSDFDETKTVYIHSGKNIVFNKPIDQKFTVYYQYLPSNLRVRIVLRVNDLNYVSPSVNSIQIKTKTKKADPRKSI